MVEQLTEQGDAGHAGHIVLGCLDHHWGDPLEGPEDDHVFDVEQRRGTLSLGRCAFCWGWMWR